MKKSITLTISFVISLIFNQSVSARETNYIATYFGGSANESSWAITLDDAGNVYVTGYTASPDFPTKPESYVSAAKGKGDVFVLKFDKELETILASALVGGSEDEVGYSILYDRKGYLYIAGYTGSEDFPVTPSAYCTKYNGGEGDAFILKMDKDLKSLTASTFLGGSSDEGDWYSAEMVMDKDGAIYIAGNTASADFPTTNGAYDVEYNGGGKDVFVSKFDSGLENLLASTLFGGSANDQIGRSLSLDTKTNEICIAGITFSPDFPTPPDAYSRMVSGNLDGYVAKFTPDLTSLTRATILPSGWIYCMFIHENGDIYVGGHTAVGLPATRHAFYKTFDKNIDQGFISRFSNDLTELKSSTVLPGSGTPEQGGEITSLNLSQSAEGDVVSAGWAGPRDFPSTPNAFDETQNGGLDAYILTMNKDLSAILASTFIGGSHNERWNRMTQDTEGNWVIASYTLSQDFPTTSGSASEKYNGGGTDGFVFKLDHALSAIIYEPFHDAAKKDNLKVVKNMLSNRSELLEISDQYQRTVLHSAGRYGALQVINCLIGKGANLNARDESGNTPLHLAVLHSQDEAAELIMNANPDINAVNGDGESPLSLATVYGTSKSLGLLLSNKADGRIRDKEGNTLLHVAALHGNIEKVQEILKYEPDIEIKNSAGNTPLLSAVKRFENEAVIGCLLDNGAHIATVDSTGKGVIHVANNSNIKFLLQKGADVNLQDRDGNTPLHNVLLGLLEYKVFYPFMKENTNLFLAAGADPDIKNKQGKSPMDLAEESGVEEAIDLLKNRR
ncbi:MAG: ankyrin repeat domain-containing protein [Planctomycetota bacterium]